MQIQQPPVNPNGLILPGEVSFGAPPKDSAALKIVVQDFDNTERWLNTKQYALRWKQCQELYDSMPVRKYWEGTSVPRSSVQIYTVATHAQSIAPQILNGLFSDDPPFMIKPRPGTKQETARAVGEVLHYQLEDCGFRQELKVGIESCLTFGTVIFKWGWEQKKETRKTYQRIADPVTLDSGAPGIDPVVLDTQESDELKATETEVSIDRPVFEHCDLHHVYVDPSLRVPDIRRAKFVIHRLKVSAHDLEQLRSTPGYDIPDEQTLKSYLFGNEEQSPTAKLELNRPNSAYDHQAIARDNQQVADPIEEARFEILERWDGEKVVAVLNRKLVIRNEHHGLGVIPFVSVNWWNVPNSFYGLGLAHTIGYEQLIQKGLIDARLDQVAINLNRGFIQVRGKNVPTQNIRLRPSGIYVVDDPKDLQPMQKIEAVAEGFMEVQASEARAEGISGANEQMVMGNTPDRGRTSLGRTATGANLLAGGSQSRLESFVETIGDQVFEPTLNAFHEMNRHFLPLSTLRRLLTEELQTAFAGDHLDILNARLSFDVLAAARIQQRRQMAQNLPFLLQTLITDPMHAMLSQQGLKVDVKPLVDMVFDVSGWKNEDQIILEMTQEDMQRMQQSNPELVKAQAQQQAIAAQTLGRRQVIEDENTARAVRDVIREGVKNQINGDQ